MIKHIRSCPEAKARKIPPRAATGKLGQYVGGEPLEKLARDLFGALPRTEKGSNYVAIISDYFTRWIEA